MVKSILSIAGLRALQALNMKRRLIKRVLFVLILSKCELSKVKFSHGNLCFQKNCKCSDDRIGVQQKLPRIFYHVLLFWKLNFFPWKYFSEKCAFDNLSSVVLLSLSDQLPATTFSLSLAVMASHRASLWMCVCVLARACVRVCLPLRFQNYNLTCKLTHFTF